LSNLDKLPPRYCPLKIEGVGGVESARSSDG
jgi:hypothetical protein